MTETRKDLLGALWQIQAHPLFQAVDLITAAASPNVSDDQVRRQIEGCMTAIASVA